MTSLIDLRLVAYEPAGNYLGTLPDAMNISSSFAISDVGALSFDYPLGGTNDEFLDEPCELAVQIFDGTDWIEPRNGRFIRLASSGDAVQAVGVRKFDCPSYAWLLSRALVLLWGSPASGISFSTGQVTFQDLNAGVILSSLLAAASARGAFSGLTYSSFNGTTDSAGAAWDPASFDARYELGSNNVLDVLDRLADQGFIEWGFDGRALKVYNPGTYLAEDRSIPSSTEYVDFLPGRDVVAVPYRVTWEELNYRVTVVGADVATITMDDNTTPSPWGEWERYISAGGVSDSPTLSEIGAAALAKGHQPRQGVTATFVPRLGAWSPFIDYQVGDYVAAPGPTGVLEKQRILQITLNRKDQLDGSLSLGARYERREEQMNRRIARKLSRLLD